MPAEPRFKNDKLETVLRKCIVFPANGSPTCVAHMSIRTVTTDDTSALGIINRCVEMSSRFGDETRKTRLRPVGRDMYMFYNLSPQLPVNLNILRLFDGFTPWKLQTKKRLFWRGDVVVMKVLPESERIDFIVQPLDASTSDIDYLEQILREMFNKGHMESDLRFDEEGWNFYISYYCGPSSVVWGAPQSYWGENASKKEEQHLSDLNELRHMVGRPPIPPHKYMKSFIGIPGTIYEGLKSVFGKDTAKVKGPPVFPEHLERKIFETCALECPETCVELVRVAKRVNEWLDPMLIRTIYISSDVGDKRDRFTPLVKKFDSGKPVEYYAEHVKNVALFGFFWDNANEINRIFAVCTGITNLVINAAIKEINIFERHLAWSHLRRLTINLYKHSLESNFGHPAFRNLTHLHLLDDDEDWPYYTGWHNLINLTHLALACSGPAEATRRLIQKLPKVRYVALGFYRTGKEYVYAEAVIDNNPHMRAAWGEQVVYLREIPALDWERGARGEGDFWDLVEREIQNRLQVLDGATVDGDRATVNGDGPTVDGDGPTADGDGPTADGDGTTDKKKKKKKKKKKTKRSFQDGLDV